MSKYAPLADYLRSQTTREVPMTFADIERVIGTHLPARAPRHPAWWSNSTTNNTMTKVWLDAGFKTERVDVNARKLVFRRQSDEPSSSTSGPGRPQGAAGFVERARLRLAGTVTVSAGVDLTAPAGAVWNAERE